MSYYKALGLLREPFSNSPDPDLLYRARTHLECLQHMEIAVRLRRGLNVVLGEVGTGKTTLGRELARLLAEDGSVEVHFLDDPYQPTPLDFLKALSRLFGLDGGEAADDAGLLRETLKAGLSARGEGDRIVALIVDEGQKMTPECLELLRELLNVETNTHKLLQIVIFAQTEFEDVLAARPNLDDRVNFRYRLLPLDRGETRRMIETRLALCTPDGLVPPVFTPLALRRIHRLTRGYPRKIVRLCHLSMLLAVGFGKPRIGWGLVGRAARQSRGGARAWLRPAAVAGTLGAAALAGLLFHGPGLPGARQTALGLLLRATAALEGGSAASLAPKASLPVASFLQEPAGTPQAPEETAPGMDGVSVDGSWEEAEVAEPAATGQTAESVPAARAAEADVAARPEPASERAEAAPATPGQRFTAWALRAETVPRPAAAASRRPAPDAAAAVPAETAGPSRATAPLSRQGLGAALDLATAAFPPDAPEQVIVIAAEGAGNAAAADARPAEAAPETLGTCVVRPGWTVSRLANKLYGNGGRQVLAQLAKANPGLDFERVRAGDAVVYPALAAKAPPAGSYLVKVAGVADLEEGFASIAKWKEKFGLALSLYCTGHPGAGLRVEVVLPALFPNRDAAGEALAALPAELAGQAALVGGYPAGTTFYTDLGEGKVRRTGKAPVPARQVAERRPTPFVAPFQPQVP
ncbi:AAA ATPase [Solidesulfovibrio carbinoliphilus subsp. oakridgensis]|uniref:AAA ATPase n=1 Tax=Solidesulfovibrio carbinoliphilus subsp. oakridgensis TaxID=694327 RepID=G7Q8W5_9BACT|nr:AAA family ATPase [Solidesulfovibrio carbinoliphilus]EHJ47451.1 AAA ATPase [Solidesulfovibrio carbinoliphilus subsp. oakridgensis]